MADTATSGEVDAAIKRVTDLRVSLANAEVARVAAIRAKDDEIALGALKSEEAALQAALAEVEENSQSAPPAPAPTSPPVPPTQPPAPPAPTPVVNPGGNV